LYRRRADIRTLQLELEFWYSDHRGYPSLLTELLPGKYGSLLKILTDPLDKKPYFYIRIRETDYHIGANLEQRLEQRTDGLEKILAGDADFDSRSFSGFFGSDDQGCKGETNRYCYDKHGHP
jgi:hypothetical protein